MANSVEFKLEFTGNLTSVFGQLSESLSGLNKALAVFTEALSEVSGKTSGLKQFSNAVGGLGDNLEDATGLAPKVRELTGGVDRLSQEAPKVSGLKGAFMGLKRTMDEMGSSALAMNQLRQSVDTARQDFSNFTAGARSFEDAMANIKTIVGTELNNSEYEALGSKALALASDYGISGAQMLDAYQKLASVVDIKSIGGAAGLERLGEQVIGFSKATGVGVEEAAKAVTGTLNQFSLATSEASRVMNVIAAGSRVGAAEVADQIMSMKELGVAAQGAGVSLEQSVAAFQVLASANVKGSQAGNQFANVLLRLQTQLGKDLSNGGLVKALEELGPQVNNASAMYAIFGAENMAAAQLLIKNVDGLKNYERQVSGTTSVQEMLAIQMGTTNSKMSVFSQTIENFTTRLLGAVPWLGLVTEGVGKIFVGAIVAVQGVDALQKITSLLTVANIKSAWASTMDGIAKTRAAIASRAMALGNVLAAASTWTLTGSLAALSTAIYNIPLVGWILAGVAAMVALVAYWDELRYALLGVWEVVKGIFTAMLSIVTLDFSKAWEELSGLGDAFSKGYTAAADADRAQAGQDGQQQAVLDGLANNALKPGSDAALMSMPVVPGAELGIGTSAAGGGALMTSAAPSGAVTNSQKIDVGAINITVTTPRDLVEQVKKEVLEAVTKALSPSVGMALYR